MTINLETTHNNNYQEQLLGNLETTPNQKVHTNTMTEHTPNIHQTSTKTINQNDQGGTIIIQKQKVDRNLETTSNTKIHKPNNQKHTNQITRKDNNYQKTNQKSRHNT